MSFAESFNWFLVGKTLPISQMKRVSLLALVFAFFVGACEQHHWEDVDENGDGVIDQNERGTKRLYKEHKAHDDHGDGHDEEEGH